MKPFTAIAALLLGVISLLQLIRSVLSWPVSVNGFAIPIWASVIACLVTGILAVMLWRERRP